MSLGRKMMPDPSQGIPFSWGNLNGETYFNKDVRLFKYSATGEPTTPEELPDEGEVITVHAKQMGRIVLVHAIPISPSLADVYHLLKRMQ